MEIIQKAVLNLSRLDYFVKHLSIINPFISIELTPKEREVLGAFMSFQGDMADKDRFGTTFRKEVKKQLKMSDGGLGNHLIALKKKEAITEGLNGTLVVPSYLFPHEGHQFYQFKITEKDE